MRTPGIRDALLTGRGSVRMRAVTDIVENKRNRMAIIVTEIPYQVSIDRVMTKIADLVKDKTIAGIADLRNETNKNGIRMVIELKRDANPQVVLNLLFKHTQLEDSFGVNAVALVDGVPRTLNIAEMVAYYIDHQLEVIERRSMLPPQEGGRTGPHRRGPAHRPRQHRRGRQDHPDSDDVDERAHDR